jgi:hypothetical protein
MPSIMSGSYHSRRVDALWHDLSLAYERHIEATGKEMHFLILLSFLGSFGFIRTSAHMIRAQVSWWPGNVETKGGTHIHHMFWGILLLMTMGYLGLATDMGSPWLELTGIAFGIGLGLTLDEFALWLNLQDVYWSEKGRQSIDAVIVATLMLVVALIGLQFWIDVREAVLLAIGIGGQRFVGAESLPWLLGFQLVGIAAAVVCWLKGKRLFAIVGAFVPIVGLYGALTKPRDDSWWTRRGKPSPAHSSA